MVGRPDVRHRVTAHARGGFGKIGLDVGVGQNDGRAGPGRFRSLPADDLIILPLRPGRADLQFLVVGRGVRIRGRVGTHCGSLLAEKIFEGRGRIVDLLVRQPHPAGRHVARNVESCQADLRVDDFLARIQIGSVSRPVTAVVILGSEDPPRGLHLDRRVRETEGEPGAGERLLLPFERVQRKARGIAHDVVEMVLVATDVIGNDRAVGIDDLLAVDHAVLGKEVQPGRIGGAELLLQLRHRRRRHARGQFADRLPSGGGGAAGQVDFRDVFQRLPHGRSRLAQLAVGIRYAALARLGRPVHRHKHVDGKLPRIRQHRRRAARPRVGRRVSSAAQCRSHPRGHERRNESQGKKDQWRNSSRISYAISSRC